MAIKVKAIERNVAFVKGEEKWAYVLQADLYSKLSDAKVIQEAALRSGGSGSQGSGSQNQGGGSGSDQTGDNTEPGGGEDKPSFL